jgi:hypothetical protein
LQEIAITNIGVKISKRCIMATLKEKPRKEGVEEGRHILTVHVEVLTSRGYSGCVGQTEAERETSTVLKMVNDFQIPAYNGKSLVRLVGRVVAFYFWLSGPPMTEQERTQHKISVAEQELRNLFLIML